MLVTTLHNRPQMPTTTMDKKQRWLPTNEDDHPQMTKWTTNHHHHPPQPTNDSQCPQTDTGNADRWPMMRNQGWWWGTRDNNNNNDDCHCHHFIFDTVSTPNLCLHPSTNVMPFNCPPHYPSLMGRPATTSPHKMKWCQMTRTPNDGQWTTNNDEQCTSTDNDEQWTTMMDKWWLTTTWTTNVKHPEAPPTNDEEHPAPPTGLHEHYHHPLAPTMNGKEGTQPPPMNGNECHHHPPTPTPNSHEQPSTNGSITINHWWGGPITTTNEWQQGPACFCPPAFPLMYIIII